MRKLIGWGFMLLGGLVFIHKQTREKNEKEPIIIRCWLCKNEFEDSTSNDLVVCFFCGIENHIETRDGLRAIGNYPPLDFKTHS